MSGSLRLQRLAAAGVSPESVSGVADGRVIEVNVSTAADDTITIDLSQPPSLPRIGPTLKSLWRSRTQWAERFIEVGQPVRVRVAGQTWLSIDVARSRLGRLLGMPGLTIKVAGGRILRQRFQKPS